MGRRRRRPEHPNTVPDAIFQTPNRSLAPLFRDVAEYEALTEIEDFRRYTPFDTFDPPPMEIGGRVANKPKIKKTKLVQLPWQLTFDAPDKTVVCVRRKRRREVIFAKNRGGGGPRRKPRRSKFSDIGC